MKKYFIISFLGFIVLLSAQTSVSGAVSGTWTSAGNPYNVTGNLTVANGTTLNIDEGVEIYFQGDYNIIIDGTLNAVGTPDDKLLFTTGGTATEFGGIRLDGADAGSILSYAIVENGVASVNNHAGGIYIDNCSPTVSYCEIRNCSAAYGGGIFVHNSASPIIEWNVIHDNTATSLGGGIGFNGGGTNLATIRFNEIFNNENTNSTNGGGGISFYNGTNADIYNNVIFGNIASGATFSGGVYAHNTGNVITMWNNIIWGNTNGGTDPQINERYANTWSVTYCDVQVVYTGTGNISSDPLFANTTPGSEDFFITPGSPCIDVGSPTSDVPIGGGSTIDIDAQEFMGSPPGTGGGTDVIKRYWELEASGNAFIRLFFNSDEITDITSPKIFQFIGGSWTEIASSAVGMVGTSLYLNSSNAIDNWGSRAASMFTIGEEDAPLPIVLSNFAAVQTSGNLAQIVWTTQSESDLIGYNLFRSETGEYNNSLQINTTIIEGTNNTYEQSYSYTDEYVYTEVTYYYWLESVETDNTTNLYGPVSITLHQTPDDNIPEMPFAFGLHSVYPNPFNPTANILYMLEEESTVNIKIYNGKGQTVNEFDEGIKEAGTPHTLVWDGTDKSGKTSASGIYFIKLTANDRTDIKRALMVK